MPENEIELDIKKLRTQARNEVIILFATLFLVFLWITNISWAISGVGSGRTFSGMALSRMGDAIGIGSYMLIPVTFIVTVLYTIFYILLVKNLIMSFKTISIDS